MSQHSKYPTELYAIVCMVYPQHNAVTLMHIPIVSTWDDKITPLPNVMTKDLRMACRLLYGRPHVLYEIEKSHIFHTWVEHLDKYKLYHEWEVPHDVTTLTTFYEEQPVMYVESLYYIC